MEMKKFGLNEIKLFHFHRIFKTGGGERGSSDPPEPLLDPPLHPYDVLAFSFIPQTKVGLYSLGSH